MSSENDKEKQFDAFLAGQKAQRKKEFEALHSKEALGSKNEDARQIVESHLKNRAVRKKEEFTEFNKK